MTWNKWLIRAQSWARSSAVYWRSAASPSLAVRSFWITTFTAWKAPSILFVASMMRPYWAEGKGPRSSNSLDAAPRRLSSRSTKSRKCL